MNIRHLAGTFAVAALLAAPVAADPAPDFTEAHALLGRWLDAQNGRKFDDYIALYADDFAGIKRTASDKETHLTLAEWRTDRQKMFKSKNLTLEIFAEQYAREASGAITVGFRQFYRSGSYADQGLKAMMIAKRDGKLLIVREEINAVQKLDPGVVVTGSASEDAAPAMPSNFATRARVDWPVCKKKGGCDMTLLLGDAGKEKKVSLGLFESDADGEFTGDLQVRFRAFNLVGFGPYEGAIFAVADGIVRESPALTGRHAAIVGKGPGYPTMWSGTLVTDKKVFCRAAMMPDSDGKSDDLVYDCAGKHAVLHLRDGRFQ